MIETVMNMRKLFKQTNKQKMLLLGKKYIYFTCYTYTCMLNTEIGLLHEQIDWK